MPHVYAIDAGPLLVHAFAAFQHGRYLDRVAGTIPRPDQRKVCTTLDKLLRSAKQIILTPLVLSEFQSVGKSQGGLDAEHFGRLLRSYSQMLVKMYYFAPDVSELVGAKNKMGLWQLSFTDTSLFLASLRHGAVVVSLDRALVAACRQFDLSASHVYYDLYLGQEYGR